MLQLVKEPPVDLGDVVNHVVRHAALEGLVDAERALGVLHMQVLDDFFRRSASRKSGSVIVSRPSSVEETAFIMACSKLLPMAMTSPVAFIWVPRDLSA